MQVFAVKGHRMVLDRQRPVLETVPDFRVYNIGRESVYAEAKYGTAFGWSGGITSATVDPGENTVIETLSKPYFRTGLYLENNSDDRALVYCDYKLHYRYGDFPSDGGREIAIDINGLAKQMASFAVSKIPTVGPVLSIIVKFFWPDTQGPSVWDQIHDEVEHLIDSKTNEVIRGILGGDLRYLEERILVLEQDLEKHQHGANAHFMNIAEDLIGFEKKFAFTKENNSNFGEVNYFILPMYSNLVTMKLNFYAFGILNQSEIGLSDEQVQRLKEYSERLVYDSQGAIHHVNEVLLERVLDELNHCIPSEVFDAVATVRTYCALNGTEYIAYWEDLLMDPGAEKKPYNDAISYSKGFGTVTPKQARQIIPIELDQPLTPDLIDGKRNEIIKFNVTLGAPDRINWFVVYFENGDMYEMGAPGGSESHVIDFDGKYLTRLSAWDDGKLTCLEFAFSDGRVVTVGTKTGEQEDFQLENHHIAGIFLDGPAVGMNVYDSANICVSYQLTPEE